MPELPLPLILSQEYTQMLGTFYSNWSAIDLFTDYAICQFLHVTPEQSHLITSGMMFGRKAKLLDDLLRHSNDYRKKNIYPPFNKIRAAKRDLFAHSYVGSNATSVFFLERSISGKYSAKKHTFTMQEFGAHVKEIATAAREFFYALDVSLQDLDAFAETALSLKSKSDTSPGSPPSGE